MALRLVPGQPANAPALAALHFPMNPASTGDPRLDSRTKNARSPTITLANVDQREQNTIENPLITIIYALERPP
jgi:hypothetical protein